MAQQISTVQRLESCLDRLEGLTNRHANSEQHALESLFGSGNSKKRIIRIFYYPKFRPGPKDVNGRIAFEVIRVKDGKTINCHSRQEMIKAVRDMMIKHI
jgi:hypothetical protein